MDSTAKPTAGLLRQVVYYSGRVQGVGFRQTTCDVAQGFAVTGFVQNLPDGRVLLTVEGKSSDIEQFLAALRSRLHRHITACDIHAGSASGEWSGFTVRY